MKGGHENQSQSLDPAWFTALVKLTPPDLYTLRWGFHPAAARVDVVVHLDKASARMDVSVDGSRWSNATGRATPELKFRTEG
jgi:hypothetical protein